MAGDLPQTFIDASFLYDFIDRRPNSAQIVPELRNSFVT